MNTNGNYSPNRLEKVVVHHLIFAVLFVLSLFSNITESGAEVRPADDEKSFVSSASHHHGIDHGHDLPFRSKGTPPGEKPNETDLEEEIDDGDGKESWHRSIASCCIPYSSTQLLRLHCKQLSQNHHPVSLFILYHSWKSYLS